MKRLLAFVICLILLNSQLLSQSAPGFWSDIVAFKKIDSAHKPAMHAILFVGSSSFTKWQDVQDYFPDYPIINRGFGGSTVLDVIRYTYDLILPYQPKQVVIYCGENDLAYQENTTPEEVLLRVKTLFNMIRTNLPDATIDYVSIKPSPVRSSIQTRVIKTNQLVKLFFKKQKRAAFINIYDAMLDAQGNMREELYLGDRLHMKPEGYAIWQKEIAPYLIK